MWTQFWDMHSGGRQKEEWAQIFIEAGEEEAREAFIARFGHDPNYVTCDCCGQDYSTSEYDSLEQATAYQRGCDFDDAENRWLEKPDPHPIPSLPYRTLEEYLRDPNVLAIRADEVQKLACR